MGNSVHLLETTLRDGTYEIDFQFTPEDTALIAGALDRAGVRYIEVCHGNGFGTSRWTKGIKPVRAAASDEEHLEAAGAVIERAQLGVILVVGEGFTPIEELATLTRYGVRFVRLAYLPHNIGDPSCLAYIDRARELGLTVSINLMQTYAMKPSEVAASSRETARRGAEWYYIVDSAGGMTPAETQAYVRAIREESGMVVGLHAHNNSAMAMANSLAGIEAGATRVDCTLQGIGRATGNPSTEQLLLALQRLGHEPEIDRQQVLQLGDLARSLFAEKGNDPTHFVSGSVKLHSRFVPSLMRTAKERGRASREFLYQVGKEALRREWGTKESFPDDMIELASQASAPVESTPPPKVVERAGRGIARVSGTELGPLCDELFSRAGKRRKTSVLHLVRAADFPFAAPLPWESGDLLGISVPVEAGVRVEVAEDRRPEVLVIDEGLDGIALEPRTLRLRLGFRPLVAEAAVDLAEACLARAKAALFLPADERLGALVATRLGERGIAAMATLPAGPRVVVAGTLDGAWASALESGDVVIFHGRGSGSTAEVQALRSRGVRVIRPLLSAVIVARATALLRLERRLEREDAAEVGSMRLVDPFVVPGPGEVVVDDVDCPAHVLDPVGRSLDEVIPAVAERRVRRLLTGKGLL